jgi:hypothetical protein
MNLIPEAETTSNPPTHPRWRFAFSPEFHHPEDAGLMLRAIHEEGFLHLELKGEDWERPHIRQLATEAGLQVVHVEDLTTPSLTRGILRQPHRTRREFCAQVVAGMDTLAAHGVPAFSLNFDLAEILDDAPLLAALAGLLRDLGPALYRHGLRLLLPVRIPPSLDCPMAKLPGLLRQTMSPQILLAAEIHAHESVRQSPADLLQECRFLLWTARIEYDAEAGNQLTHRLLTPWLDALNNAGTTELSFRPRTESLERAFAELTAVRHLLARLA